MINEFHNREFECGAFVPSPLLEGYENVTLANRACSTVGAVPGRSTVSGDAYIGSQYKYFNSHKWRNVGILIAFSNTYFGLQTGWISGMAMPSALIGFAYFKGLRALTSHLGGRIAEWGFGEGFSEVERDD